MEVQGKVVGIKVHSECDRESQYMIVKIRVPRTEFNDEKSDQVGYFYLHHAWCTLSQHDL